VLLVNLLAALNFANVFFKIKTFGKYKKNVKNVKNVTKIKKNVKTFYIYVSSVGEYVFLLFSDLQKTRVLTFVFILRLKKRLKSSRQKFSLQSFEMSLKQFGFTFYLTLTF